MSAYRLHLRLSLRPPPRSPPCRRRNHPWCKWQQPHAYLHSPPPAALQRTSPLPRGEQQARRQQPADRKEQETLATRQAATEASQQGRPPITRIDRLVTRLPVALRPHVLRLRSAPASHAVAFLVLHEITAIVPLLVLFALFHFYSGSVGDSKDNAAEGGGLPIQTALNYCGDNFRDGIVKFERYFKRKGWFGFREEDAGFVAQRPSGSAASNAKDITKEKELLRQWEHDPKYRLLVEVGLAWAITKALLPARIGVSLWATPWFARLLGTVRSWVTNGGKASTRSGR